MLAKSMKLAVPAQPQPVGGFVRDEESAKAIREAAAEVAAGETHVICCKITDAVRRLAKMSTPKILFVDLSGGEDAMAALASLAEVCDEGAQVVALGDLNDIAFYRSMLSLGVQDYLVKPLQKDDVKQALLRLSKANAGPGEAAASGRIIAVVGARGGVGASSVAINLAWVLGNEYKRRTALVDLDLFFGTCGLSLDLDLGRGFREALENPSRIDGLFIERAMIRESDHLFVLSGEEALDYTIAYDSSAIELLIDHLRRDFSFVVVDLPRFASRTQISMLTAPATLVVVADPSLASMRDTQRLVEFAKKTAPSGEVMTVLNGVGAPKSAELSRADFEKGASIKVDVAIPHDARAFSASLGSGRALGRAAPASKATKTIREIAARMISQGSKTAGGSIFTRLFKG